MAAKNMAEFLKNRHLFAAIFLSPKVGQPNSILKNRAVESQIIQLYVNGY